MTHVLCVTECVTDYTEYMCLMGRESDVPDSLCVDTEYMCLMPLCRHRVHVPDHQAESTCQHTLLRGDFPLGLQHILPKCALS